MRLFWQDVWYKIQLVMFDEIQEVDEENIYDENVVEEIKFMQVFFRLMDGFLLKVGIKVGKKVFKNVEFRLIEIVEDG